MRVDSIVETTEALAEAVRADSDERLIERIDELELEKQNLESHMDELISDADELYKSPLLITTETQELSIWAKAKARDCARKFYNLIDGE